MVNIVMKNINNQVVRSYRFDSSSDAHLVLLENSNRLELVTSLEALKKKSIRFRWIESFRIKDLGSKPVTITPHLKLAIVSTNDSAYVDPVLAADHSDKKIAAAFKYSSIAHAAALALVLSLGYIIQRFFTERPNEMAVVILNQDVSQKFQELKLPSPTVKVAETFRTQKTMVRAPIKTPTNKPRKRLVAQPPTQRKSPQVELGAMKALDQLGGLGAIANSRVKGTGASASGQGAFGSKAGLGGGLGASKSGIKNGLSGKGLVSGLSGEGSRAFGAHGMGATQYSGGIRGFGGRASSSGFGAIIAPDFDDSEIVGGLTREQVNSVVRKNEGQLRFCYEKALQSQPNLRGRMTSKWAIGPAGKVQFIKVTSSSLTSKEVENCVSNAIRSWQFPKPVGGVTVEVNYPFDFGRQQWMAKEG